MLMPLTYTQSGHNTMNCPGASDSTHSGPNVRFSIDELQNLEGSFLHDRLIMALTPTRTVFVRCSMWGVLASMFWLAKTPVCSPALYVHYILLQVTSSIGFHRS